MRLHPGKLKLSTREGAHQMAENRKKDTFMAIPVEKHDTAAWADMDELKPVSNVNIPSETDVRNAKEYVDTNQK
jgi:hypothetical protein